MRQLLAQRAAAAHAEFQHHVKAHGPVHRVDVKAVQLRGAFRLRDDILHCVPGPDHLFGLGVDGVDRQAEHFHARLLPHVSRDGALKVVDPGNGEPVGELHVRRAILPTAAVTVDHDVVNTFDFGKLEDRIPHGFRQSHVRALSQYTAQRLPERGKAGPEDDQGDHGPDPRLDADPGVDVKECRGQRRGRYDRIHQRVVTGGGQRRGLERAAALFHVQAAVYFTQDRRRDHQQSDRGVLDRFRVQQMEDRVP